ncbi:MAG: imidazole glycerol phosphate synthase subunit HisH [Gemmatimonadaceae bacterium]
MLTIVDYGVGNLRSLVKMFERIGVDVERTSDPNRIAEADKLILPGVGAFDAAITQLRVAELEAPLTRSVVERGVPVLGVCLGMQLLGHASEEGSERGLGWIPGTTVRLPTRDDAGAVRRLPHMGWASVRALRPNLLVGSDGRPRFYFVHSYHLQCTEPSHVLAHAEYGIRFAAAVHHDNVWGVQFHPEKSHQFGQAVLSNFARL